MAESLLPASADYTDKDFDSARRRLFALIQSVFPTWTDESVADFGNILLEMFAWCMDVVGFYQDNQAIESRITTATQRKNLLALVKLINYEPATASAAQCLARFTVDPAPPSGDPVILGGSRNPFPIVVKTGGSDPIKFELQQGLTLTNAVPTAWAVVENSESHVEFFESTGFLGQEITLAQAPYLDGSIVLTAANGVLPYEEVDNFLNSTATSKHFTVHVDNRDRAIIRFGNQVSGQLPTGTILVHYKTGGGRRGNVEPTSIVQVDGSILTEAGLPVNLKVLNEDERAAGGADRESEAQIREKAPLSLRVLTRAIAREDFEILARTRYGMARALMLTSSEDQNIPVNTGHLYVIPPVARGQSPGFPTPAKQEEILRRIRSEYPWPTTFDVRSKMPTFLDIGIAARIYLRKGYTFAQVQAQAKEALIDYFSLYNEDGSTNERVDFGYHYSTDAADGAKVLPLSDLEDAVRDCVGIHRLSTHPAEFTVSATTDNGSGFNETILPPGTHKDIPLQRHQFPRLLSLVLVDGATNQSVTVTF